MVEYPTYNFNNLVICHISSRRTNRTCPLHLSAFLNMRKTWKKWKKITKKVVAFQATVVLLLIYFIVLSPIAFLHKLYRRIFHKKRDKRVRSFWSKSINSKQDLDWSIKQ
jgi:hypothetical protein